MPHCYDLVDTLAAVSYPAETITRIIYKPRGAFIVITAQSSGSHARLYAQLRQALPNVQRIHTVRIGTDKQEGERKAAILERVNAHSYTDNNRNILATIRTILPNLDLYHMSNGRRTRFNG